MSAAVIDNSREVGDVKEELARLGREYETLLFAARTLHGSKDGEAVANRKTIACRLAEVDALRTAYRYVLESESRSASY